jgi:outer membrane protein assembly factor BamB
VDSWRQKIFQAAEQIEPHSDGLTVAYELARRRQRNRRIEAGAMGIALTVALVAGLAAVVATHGSSPAAAPVVFSLTGRVLAADVRGGSLWVLSCDQGCSGRSSIGRLVRLDPSTAGVEATAHLRSPSGLAVDDTGEWVISVWDGTVTHLDATGSVLSTTQLELPAPIQAEDTAFLPQSIAVGEGGVWVASDRGELARLDPSTGSVEKYIALPPEELGGNLVADFGSVWIVASLGLSQLDPATNQVVQTISITQNGLTLAPNEVAVGGSELWVTGVWARPVTDEAGTASLELTDGWAVASVDPATGKVTSITSVAEGTSLVAGAGQLWVVSASSSSARQVRGGRLAPVTGLEGKLVAVDSDRVWSVTRGGEIVASPA